jgi:hypothetical protein
MLELPVAAKTYPGEWLNVRSPLATIKFHIAVPHVETRLEADINRHTYVQVLRKKKRNTGVIRSNGSG